MEKSAIRLTPESLPADCNPLHLQDPQIQNNFTLNPHDIQQSHAKEQQ